MDRLSPERRSWLMSKVSSKNTKPELTVRSLLHQMGYRFRIHTSALLGKPDIVFHKRKKIIFVHGCFWHGHDGCKYGKLPQSRIEFWQEKINRNRIRDIEVTRTLTTNGWQILIIWQCEIRDEELLIKNLVAFLGSPKFFQ